MEENEFLDNRIDDQINYYDGKSQGFQKKYKFFKITEITFAALIPVSVSLPFSNWIVSILGALITIIEGYLNISKSHENWIEYRSIAETLKHEKSMYLTKSGVYNFTPEGEVFRYFVERTENIISKENVNWANMQKKK